MLNERNTKHSTFFNWAKYLLLYNLHPTFNVSNRNSEIFYSLIFNKSKTNPKDMHYNHIIGSIINMMDSMSLIYYVHTLCLIFNIETDEDGEQKDHKKTQIANNINISHL